MTEPTISCPKCQAEIKLTESLAAPLVEATRREYEQRLERSNAEYSKREEKIRQQEHAFAKSKQDWQAAEQARLQAERERIAKEEKQRASIEFSQS